MEPLSNPGVSIAINMDAAIEIIRHAGKWMRETGAGNYSEWWDPDKVSEEKLRDYVSPQDFYVVSVGGQPAAMSVIQSKQTLQDWSSIDKRSLSPKAIYVDYVAVEREFAGQGLVRVLIEKAEELGHQRGASVMRLDTNANEPKLCNLYESFGFQRAGVKQEGDYTIVYYEKPIIAAE